MNNYLTNTFLRAPFQRFWSVGLSLFLFSGALFAATVNLAWDASTSSNVGGYKVSYGLSSGNYTSTIDAGNTTTYPMPGLQEGTQYYFAVKAYDSARTTESAYSNEVNMVMPVTTAITTDFTANPTSGAPGMVVSFTPITTGTITSWTWDFPGSYTPSVTNPTAQVVTVTYPTAGTYTVSLTANGPSGSAPKTKSNFITVTSTPVANFTAIPTSGIAPVSVSFTDTSTGNITTRSWNFGDGSTSTDVSPTHTYSAAGAYTVSLTVTGAGGSNTKTNSNFISVSSPITSTSNSNNGLVAAYGFEEVSGTTVADASGNGNHGTIKEAVRIATGKYGKALKFDGVNDWVTVNDSASLDLSTGMTLEAWVYQQSSMSNTIMVKEGAGVASYEFYSSEDLDLPVSYFNDGSYHSVFGTNPVPLNKWTHLVSTYDGQYQRLYVNGVKVAQSELSGLIQTSSGALRIGGNNLWGEYFQGYIDEVRIYNRALTEAEISYNLSTAISTSNPLQPVMGNTTLEPWADYRNQGIAEAFQTVPQKSGVVSTVQVYLNPTSTATQLVAGIYKNNNGHPGALVAKGTLSTLKPGAWNSVPIPVASVTAAQPYWIAILGSKGQIGFLDQVGSATGLMETSSSSTLTSLPSTWTGSATKTNAAMSVYGKGY